MSIPLTVTGTIYNYPVNFDTDWGVDATGWAQAVTNGMLQKSGGSFPLTAQVDFGSSFGMKVLNITSETTNPATTGYIRLAKTDAIDWRNNANSANLPLAIDGGDNLTFNGVVLATNGGGTVNLGTANHLAYYATSSTAVSDASGAILSGNYAFSSGLTLTSATNQIAFHSANQTTINAIQNVGSNWTVSIPALTANDSFALIGKDQTFTGLISFGQQLFCGNGMSVGNNSIATSNTFPSSSNIGSFSNMFQDIFAERFDVISTSGTTVARIAAADQDNSPFTVTIPNPAGGFAANMVLSEGAATINGAKTFGSTVTAPSFTPNTTSGIIGTTTNNDAAAGSVGEYFEATASATAPTSTQWADATSLSLTAGDWDISVAVSWVAGSGGAFAWTSGWGGLGTVSGNNAPVQNTLDYQQAAWVNSATTPTIVPITVPVRRRSLSGTTTVYLKVRADYTAGTNNPSYAASITARRVR